MLSMVELLKQQVEQIVQYQLDTGEQMKWTQEKGNRAKQKFLKLPPSKQEELWNKYFKEQQAGLLKFNDTGFIKSDALIGVFMDFQKYKPLRSIEQEKKKGAPLHSHNYFEMFYVYRGHCFSSIDGVEREFKAGELCLYNLQAAHFCTLPSEHDIVFNIIIRESAIDDTMIKMMSDENIFSNFFLGSLRNVSSKTSMIFSTRSNEELLFYLYKLIITYYNAPITNNSLMRSLMVCLFHELAKQYQKQADEQSRKESKGIPISEILTYLDQNYRNISLQQTAEHFYYSPRSLSNLLQKYTNKKFSQILQEIRLQKACNLLKDPNIPLESIPQIVGYSDRHYLDKLFRNVYGVSILKYRKTYCQEYE